MLALMKRHRLWPPLAVLLLALLVAAAALLMLDALPDTFEYLWPAPVPTAATQADGSTGDPANDGLRDARLRMADLTETLAGACEPLSLSAVLDGASVVADQENAQAATVRLTALNDGAFSLFHPVLKAGRLFYPDELQQGARVCMMNEKLAVALWGYAEPIDRLVLLEGKTYRIVGVTGEQRRVGDRLEHNLYIPYRAAEVGGLTFDALCVTARPVPGAGGWSAFEAATAALAVRGTATSLPKEKMNAALPLRLLGCLFAAMALWFALRALNARVVRLYRAFRLRLMDQYAARLLVWLVLRILPLVLGYAAVAYLFAQVFMALVAPVYTFPEWIPKVLVEPKDIAEAFWNVWTKQAAVVQLRSPALLRIRFYQMLVGWACGVMGIAGGLLAGRMGDMMKGPTKVEKE
jgi:hypothetical protein